MNLGEHLNWPDAPCLCFNPADELGCICAVTERALRGWIRGDSVPPMTLEQRAFCLDEIGSIEGYRREEHEGENDAQLARTTINAWTDYCRDKGLL